MISLRIFRRIVAVVWFVLIVGVFVLSGEGIWLGIIVGLLMSCGYIGMTARARAAGWFGPPGEEKQPVKLGPLVAVVLVMLFVMGLFYLVLFAVFA